MPNRITADTITDEQIRKVLAHARRIKNRTLAACAMRALDGDSMYDRGLRERCAKAINAINEPAATKESITDAQIQALMKTLKRELREARRETGPFAAPQVELLKSNISTCSVALTDRRAMAMLMPGVARGVENARARCAQILNARNSKES